jgi:aryl-alcohol dehydrogenase-like predicted oxidoreductase
LPLLKAAYDRGLNTWDTANVYSNGVSEKIIAKAIKQYNIPRHKLVILTKCYAPVSEVVSLRVGDWSSDLGKSKDYVNQHGKFARLDCNHVEREKSDG